jgi:hypothetical protein
MASDRDCLCFGLLERAVILPEPKKLSIGKPTQDYTDYFRLGCNVRWTGFAAVHCVGV